MNNKKITKKKMSIEDLSVSVREGFKRVESLIEEKIDKLAISTAKGFDGVEARMATKKDSKIQEDVSQIILKEIKIIHEENKYFRASISGLNLEGLSYDKKISDLDIRVEKLESKVK